VNGPVSAVIPVHNGRAYLAEAIESVLAQNGGLPGEVIVVDDGSTDGSGDLARGFPGVRVLTQARAGYGAAMNRGVAACGGAYLAFLDSDDLWTPDKTASQIRALESEPRLDAVFGTLTHFYSPDLDEVSRARIVCPPDPMPGLCPGAMLIRREAFLRAGTFDESRTVGQFLDWYLRATEQGFSAHALPDVAMRRRLHANNTGLRERAAQADYARILKAALDRRRGASGADR